MPFNRSYPAHPPHDSRLIRILSRIMLDVTGEEIDDERAAGMILRTLEALPEEQAVDLSRAARFFDSGLGGVFSIARPSRYLEAARGLRLRRLESFSRSRIPVFRTIATGLHRFGAAAWWSLDEHQAAIGVSMEEQD